jgi:epoxide hydrolase-like predicted phosphatase
LTFPLGSLNMGTVSLVAPLRRHTSRIGKIGQLRKASQVVAVKAVVFDIGGVLKIAPRISEFKVFKSWEENLGLEPGQISSRTRSAWEGGRIGSISEEELHRHLGKSLGWDHAQVAAFMVDFWVEYAGTTNVELVEYFRGLRPRYRTAMLSNSFVGAREREQEFSELADLIIYSHEVGISKPEHRIYELACERLGVQAKQAVFLDDAEQYVAAAREVGMHGILFKGNAQAIADIEAWLRG